MQVEQFPVLISLSGEAADNNPSPEPHTERASVHCCTQLEMDALCQREHTFHADIKPL